MFLIAVHLSQEYSPAEGKETIPMADALALAVKVISKTLDTNKLTADKVEFATITKDEFVDKTILRILPNTEVAELIKKHAPTSESAAAAARAT